MPDNWGEHTLVQLVRSAAPFAAPPEPPPMVQADRWPAIVEAATRHGLAPLLHQALKATGRSTEPPHPLTQLLRDAYLKTGIANWLVFRELRRLLTSFDAEQVPAIQLKGCALANWLYPDPALRPLGDLDLLIPSDRLERADRLLRSLGYAPRLELDEGFQTRFSNEQTYTRGGAPPIQLDLHWHIFGARYYATHVPIEWFWQRAMPIDWDERQALIFAPESQFLHLATHLRLQHGRQLRLIWSHDLALMLSQYGSALDWSDVETAARAFRLTLSLRQAIQQATELWGVRAPVETMRRIATVRPGWKERALLEARTMKNGSGAQLVIDTLGQPGLASKTAYTLGKVFPGKEFMQRRYRFSSDALLPLCYAWRIVKGLYFVGLAGVCGLAGLIGALRRGAIGGRAGQAH